MLCSRFSAQHNSCLNCPASTACGAGDPDHYGCAHCSMVAQKACFNLEQQRTKGCAGIDCSVHTTTFVATSYTVFKVCMDLDMCFPAGHKCKQEHWTGILYIYSWTNTSIR